MTQLNQPTPAVPAVRSILVSLMMAIFLGALDQTIVAVSMPAISAQFHDVNLLAWVISGYMVAMTVAVPIYGKLGDLYGRRPMMLIGMGLFTLASLFCGMAQSMEQLVLARVLQGIGAGGMISVSQAIIGDIIPPRERGRYQGYFSSMYAVASVAGPVLGGYMTEYLSWRWVFLINLPLGAGAWYGGPSHPGRAAVAATQADHRLPRYCADDHRLERLVVGHHRDRPGPLLAR